MTIIDNPTTPYCIFCAVISSSVAKGTDAIRKCEKNENKTRHIVVKRLIA